VRPRSDTQIDFRPLFPVPACRHGLNVNTDTRKRSILFENFSITDNAASLQSGRKVYIDDLLVEPVTAGLLVYFS
jgi:hypothetical protein